MNWPTAITYLVMIIAWVMGMAVAKGWWLLLAALIPPAAWVMLAMHYMGV